MEAGGFGSLRQRAAFMGPSVTLRDARGWAIRCTAKSWDSETKPGVEGSAVVQPAVGYRVGSGPVWGSAIGPLRRAT